MHASGAGYNRRPRQRSGISMDKLTGAGGTPGGIPMFLIGFAMAVAGGYLLTSQVTVTTGFWTFFGQHVLSLLPFIGVLMRSWMAVRPAGCCCWRAW
jgi:hypothetical protein